MDKKLDPKMKSKNKQPVNINPEFNLSAQMFGGYSYNNELLMINVTDLNKDLMKIAGSHLASTSFRLEALTVLLVVEGTLDISIDYKEYTIPEKSMLLLSPINTINDASSPTGGRFFLLMIKKDILDRIAAGLNPKPILPVTPTFADFILRPHFKLEDNTFFSLERSLHNLYHYLKDQRMRIKQFLIDHSLSLVLLEILNFISENSEMNIGRKTLGRKKELMNKFMALVRESGDKQHYPSFYANKLFISVQYLSFITKKETGMTATQILAAHLATRARLMLRSNDASIKETAERLNFADQSSFGKFFKKETGMSPKKYLESL